MEVSIQTEPISTEAKPLYSNNIGYPFKENLNQTTASTEGPSEGQPQFQKISENHARNMTEISTSKGFVWGGELPGDIYGARTIKGTSMSVDGDPAKLDAGDTYYGVMGIGLMDDRSIPRITKASELLRKNGLPTECPRTVKKLQEVLVKDKNGIYQKMPIKEWEENQLNNITSFDRISLESAKKYLDETDFVALERDVQVDERLQDLQEALYKGGFRAMIEPIFKWINVATQARNGGLISGTEKPERFNMTDEDIKRYLTDFLPSQMGVYLGRVHKLGLIHGQPHIQDWSAVATLYDLDGIYGKLLYTDDPEQTNVDVDEDTRSTLKSIRDLVSEAEDSNELRNVNFGQNITDSTAQSFLKSYLAEKYSQDISLERLSPEELKLIKEYKYKL